MSYVVAFDPKVERDIARHIKAGNKKLVNKIHTLVVELAEHPRNGTGQPEPLKYHQGEFWSRRIDKEHRLIYEIVEEKLIVTAISAYGHYDDK